MESEEVLAGLERVLTPVAYSQAQYWLKSAPKEELLGAKTLVSLSATFGSELLTDLSSSTHLRSQDTLLTTPIGSVYSLEYGQNHTSNQRYMELLRYHPIRELPCTAVLTTEALKWVEKWLELKDEEELRVALVGFLRGIYSVVKVNCVFPSSVQRSCYVWYSKKDFMKAGVRRKKGNTGTNLLSSSSVVTITRDTSPGERSSAEFTPQINHSKPRKQLDMQGSALLRSQISLPNYLSTYQTAFALHFKRPVKAPKRVSPRSTSLGTLCPRD